jgi:uncharacterized cupredoxin-like copper-binding protein
MTSRAWPAVRLSGRQVLAASLAVWVGAAVASFGLAGTASSSEAAPPADPTDGPASPDDGPAGPGEVTIVLDIEHSRFIPDHVEVVAGTDVVFEVRNGDPIGHELIVGDDRVHELHETGTHASHGAKPGEVSVAPVDRATTTFAFDEPGRVRFACHLPGHVAYGMEGEVVVVEA